MVVQTGRLGRKVPVLFSLLSVICSLPTRGYSPIAVALWIGSQPVLIMAKIAIGAAGLPRPTTRPWSSDHSESFLGPGADTSKIYKLLQICAKQD